MTSLLFQLALAILLLSGAVSLLASRRSLKGETWKTLLMQIDTDHKHLASLSYGCIFSEGMQCLPDMLWHNVGYGPGLRVIYKNAGVLLRVIEYVETKHTLSPDVVASLAFLRYRARMVRFESIFMYVGQILNAESAGSNALLRQACENYFWVISHLSHLIQDHFPELLDQYVETISYI